MKKSFLITVLLAAMFAGCASEVESPQQSPESPVVQDKTPVGFSAYAERGVTRSGATGLMDITALRNATTGGFGVFAYYTNLKKYDQTYVPNFMYNTWVKDANDGVGDAAWTYSPMAYWPNESGSDASADDEDKVSFFAYAPYVAVTSAASGSVADATYGITGFSRNSTAGDPLVKYIANFNTANTVDLCWGVCNQASWGKIQGGTSQAMTVGKPWLDVEHPQGVDQKMNFSFKHALAQLNVQIDADGDVVSHDAVGDAISGNTRIYVRSISFTGIAMKGALNLNNTTANQALWLDYSGTTDLPYGESVTVKDGRRDGREGTSGADASNETPAGLNPNIIQNSTATDGVTVTYQNLFSPSGTFADPLNPTADEIAARLVEPVYVIPTGEAMTVTIVYDVETANPSLSSYLSDGTTHGSSIENKITKTIYYGGDGLSLESGKKYTLYLHLGMNSVKFDADVSSWDNTIINANGWLPENVSAVRIMKGGVQVSKVPVAITDATLALTGDVHPTAADQTLTWTSSDVAVATVASDGAVTLVAEGECTITATSTATGKTATCDLLVTHNYANTVAGDVGKIIGADGLVYTTTTQAGQYNSSGVGLICYVGAAGSVDTDASAASYKTLALALTDANGGATCQWNEITTNSCLPNKLAVFSNIYVTESAYQSGIDNTATLTTGTCATAGHTHAAASAAHDYAVDVSGFTNSGWFLPSISQWNMMIKTLAPTSESDVTSPGQTAYPTRLHNNSDIPVWTWCNAGYTAAALNPVLTAVGATGLQSDGYWSSTEHSATLAWSVHFGGGDVYDILKPLARCVRAALAF